MSLSLFEISPALDLVEKTLNSMPTIPGCNKFPAGLVGTLAPGSPSCRRTSCSSDSSYDLAPTTLNNSNISIIVDEALPSVATTRQTPGASSSIIDCATLDASLSTTTKQACTIDSNYCRAIILELQTPIYDILTFNNITSAEFHLIQSLLSDERENQPRIKLFYCLDLLQLHAVTPRPIHEVPIGFLAECCGALLAPYHLPCVKPKFRFNAPVQSFIDTVIPDFHIDLELYYRDGHPEYPIPVWIADCGFSQTRAGMEHQLEKAAMMFPEIDAALMISIREPTLQLPDADHPLLSRPALQREAFTPTSWPHANNLPPVVVEDIVWVNVTSVEIYVFLRGEDGKFDFTDGNPLSARGTLYPVLTMQSVTEMLHSASKRLLLRMANIMEQNHDDRDQIDKLRAASVDITFPVDWSSLMVELQASLHHTAWFRYTGCLKRKNKRANDHTLEPGKASKRRARVSNEQPGSTPAAIGDHTSKTKSRKKKPKKHHK